MSATVIRDFLVSLGFSVDKKSELAFNDSLKKTAENAAKLGLAIEAAAAAVTGAVVKIAQGMEQSYYQSKRLGGSVKDINAVGYAISQVGGSAEGAKQSMEGIADFMRRLPGGRSFIQKMVGTEADASNVPAVMGALAKRWSNMDYVHAKKEADFIHVDDNTLQAMIRDGGKYYEEYQKLVKKAGVNEDKLAGDSQALMVKVRGLGASFSVLGEKIQQALMGKAGAYVDKFKNWVDENFDEITKVAVKVSTAILHAAETSVGFIKSAIKWYDDLDPKGKSWAKTIAAIAGSVWLLNKAFGSSPIGIILQLDTAIATLYADYENWKKTDQVGLVDWSKWQTTIDYVNGALQGIINFFKIITGDGSDGIGGVRTAMELFATYMATKWSASIIASIAGVKTNWLGLVAALTSIAATNYMNDASWWDEMQKQADAGSGPQYIDEQKSKNWYQRPVRKATNWLYRQFGAEEPYDENLRTKGMASSKGDRVGKGSRMSGNDARVGGGVAPPTSAEKKRIAQMAFGKAIAHGYTPEQAAGFVASIAHESNFNPNASGDQGTAHGLFQYHSARRADIKASTGVDIMTATAEQQVDAALWEMERGADQKARKAGRLLKAAKTAREAGGIVSEYFERPLDREGQKAARGATAERLLPSLERGMTDAKRKKEQENFIADKLSSLSKVGLPMVDGPFAPAGAQPATPLLPNSISSNSNATMNLNVENKFMGSVSEKQVQSGVEKAGGNLLRNMQPAIR